MNAPFTSWIPSEAELLDDAGNVNDVNFLTLVLYRARHEYEAHQRANCPRPLGTLIAEQYEYHEQIVRALVECRQGRIAVAQLPAAEQIARRDALRQEIAEHGLGGAR